MNVAVAVIASIAFFAGICPAQLAMPRMGPPTTPTPKRLSAPTKPRPEAGLTANEQARIAAVVKQMPAKERKRLAKAVKKMTPEERAQLAVVLKRRLEGKKSPHLIQRSN